MSAVKYHLIVPVYRENLRDLITQETHSLTGVFSVLLWGIYCVSLVFLTRSLSSLFIPSRRAFASCMFELPSPCRHTTTWCQKQTALKTSQITGKPPSSATSSGKTLRTGIAKQTTKLRQASIPVPTYSDNTSAYYCIQRYIILARILTGTLIWIDHNSSLHTRFPFNIGPEQTPPPRAPSIITAAVDSDCEVDAVVPEKRSRRFSMSDALTVSTFTERSGSSLFASNRFLALGRQSRSDSRSRSNNLGRSSSVTADVRRSNSMIRSTFNRLNHRKKMRDEGEGEEEELERHVKERATATLTFPPDQATPANPLMEFRGGALWEAIPRDRRILGLDVFWPVQTDKLMREMKKDSKCNQNKRDSSEGEEDEEPTIFPINEMAPLCMFRNLRILKLTGMMQSYQMYIFQAAWLNTNIEELEIGMTLAPRLRRGYKWPFMKGDWRLDKATYGEPVY